MKDRLKVLGLTLVLYAALFVLWVAFLTLFSCKPDPEVPVTEDEYVEVKLNDGLDLNIGPAVWGRSPSSVLSSERIEAVNAETVSWDFVADVDPNMVFDVNFTAGSGSTGENLYTTVVYKDLATTTFRVKKGTYTQIWIAPSDDTMERTGSFMFSAQKGNATIDNSNTSVTLVAHTTWHIVIVPVSEGTIVGEYWTDSFNINGSSESCHYYYSDMDTYDLCVHPVDTPTDTICEPIAGTSTTIYLVRVGINSLIVVDTDHIVWQ